VREPLETSVTCEEWPPSALGSALVPLSCFLSTPSWGGLVLEQLMFLRSQLGGLM